MNVLGLTYFTKPKTPGLLRPDASGKRCIRYPYVQWCERLSPSANYWRGESTQLCAALIFFIYKTMLFIGWLRRFEITLSLYIQNLLLSDIH